MPQELLLPKLRVRYPGMHKAWYNQKLEDFCEKMSQQFVLGVVAV